MNNYDFMANAYREASKMGQITQEEAEKGARVFEFLATCDHEDKRILYNSGAFNDFIRNDISIVIDELAEEGILEEHRARTVRNRMYSNIFD